ncbi:hypothetical protein [Streptomyces sp. NPDC090112]|uniref:hypothetical protein n=1 Tax=Streptomyces sp. NPDC090112 TaxID=3365949 RepID=UPI0038295DE9
MALTTGSSTLETSVHSSSRYLALPGLLVMGHRVHGVAGGRTAKRASRRRQRSAQGRAGSSTPSICGASRGS